MSGPPPAVPPPPSLPGDARTTAWGRLGSLPAGAVGRPARGNREGRHPVWAPLTAPAGQTNCFPFRTLPAGAQTPDQGPQTSMDRPSPSPTQPDPSSPPPPLGACPAALRSVCGRAPPCASPRARVLAPSRADGPAHPAPRPGPRPAVSVRVEAGHGLGDHSGAPAAQQVPPRGRSAGVAVGVGAWGRCAVCETAARRRRDCARGGPASCRHGGPREPRRGAVLSGVSRQGPGVRAASPPRGHVRGAGEASSSGTPRLEGLVLGEQCVPGV